MPGDRESIDGGRQAEDRQLPVEEQGDLGHPTVGLDGVQAYPIHVERPELALDHDPPGSWRFPGTQAGLEVLTRSGVFLQRQRRAEDGPVVGAGGADVVHDVVRDAVRTATSGGDAQPDELEVGASTDTQRGRFGIDVEGDPVQLDRAEIQERTGRLREPHTDPHDGEGRLEIEVIDRPLEDVDRQAGLHHAGDPGRIDLQRDVDAGRREVESLAGNECDADSQRFAAGPQRLVGQADGDRRVDGEREGLVSVAAFQARRLTRSRRASGLPSAVKKAGSKVRSPPGEEDTLQHSGCSVRHDAAEPDVTMLAAIDTARPSTRSPMASAVRSLVLAGQVARDSGEVR